MDETNLPATVPSAPTLPATEIASRLERHAEITKGAFAENTERARESDSRLFANWCIDAGAEPLPAAPSTIAAFVDDLSRTRRPATVRRYVSTIATQHTAIGLPDPTKTLEVKAALKRMGKRLGTRQEQARGLTADDVQRIVDSSGKSLRDLRDVALVLLGRDLLARRSELVALEVDDVQMAVSPAGTGTALIRRSKTDQEGAGSVQFVSAEAFAAVRLWQKKAGIWTGPIFRRIDRNGRAMKRAMHPTSVSKALKRLAYRAGIEDAERVSGHSLRVGMAQDLVAAGADLAGVMQAGRWKTQAMPARYAEHLLAGRSVVAAYHRNGKKGAA